MKRRSTSKIKKTNLTYLPPIDAPITGFSTIYKLYEMLQSRALKARMPYVNLRFDVGAFINAFRVICNYPDTFSNVVLHLGDFHFMKEIFTIIGNLVSGSGFEDIVFQAGVCSSGSLNGVLSGSHYNRGWTIHSVLSEALERLSFSMFLEQETNVPSIIDTLMNDRDISEEELDIVNNAEVQLLLNRYQQFKEEIRNNKYGKTAKFWTVYYLDVITYLHKIHFAVQTNNFDLRLKGQTDVLPFFFALNKQNYARYGSTYVYAMQNLEKTHPGCKQLIKEKGLSVQGQDQYDLRIPIDQRGEQTVNKDAKTSGGIKYFASDSNSIRKWTLNRPAQALNTKTLYEMADVKHSNDEYKANRPSQILKSEQHVQNVLKVLTEDYINPFDSTLDKNSLFNLSSGIPIEDDMAEQILKIKDNGSKLYSAFVSNRLQSSKIKFHDPIKRQKLLLFKNSCRKVIVKQKEKEQAIEVNRQILAKLLALSAKHNQPIDFEYALTFPLTPIPLSLAHPDGTRRTTPKSALMKVFDNYQNLSTITTLPAKDGNTFLIDLMALIRTISPIPDTYAQFATAIFSRLPSGYDRIDIVTDTYRTNSLKNPEREKRGVSSKILINSAASKIPSNFNEFLKNGENKTRLIEILKDELILHRNSIMIEHGCNQMFFSMDSVCYRITVDSISEVEDLKPIKKKRTHKLLLHAKHAC